MFLFKKYFYIILILLTIPLLGLAASINSKYTFEILDPSVNTTFVTGDPLLVSWQIKGSGTILETLVNQNRIARIYLKQKTGKLDRVLKTVGSVALSNDMIECSDEQEMDCTLTQEYEWSKIPVLSSKNNYYIRITLRSKQNLGAFIKAFFLWSKYPFADSAVFNINNPSETRIPNLNSTSTNTSNTSNSIITTVTTVAGLIENPNPKNVESLPIAPPTVESPRSIIFANIDIPLEAKNYVKKNEDLYPPIYLTPEYLVHKDAGSAETVSQMRDTISKNGPYLARFYRLIGGDSTRQYRQIKFYPDGKYEEIPTQWSIVNSQLLKYYSVLPLNPNNLSAQEASVIRDDYSQRMTRTLSDIKPEGTRAGEDVQHKKISSGLYKNILSLFSQDSDANGFSCDVTSIDAISQELEAARGRMVANSPNYCGSPYGCISFNNARCFLQEYKRLCNLMTDKTAYAELIKAIEDKAIAQGYEKITLFKADKYNDLLSSPITENISLLAKSTNKCVTDTNGKCWSSYSVWPVNFTIYPSNMSGGQGPLSPSLMPTEYELACTDLPGYIFPRENVDNIGANGSSIYDFIPKLKEKYGNLAEAIAWGNGWGVPLTTIAPKGTIDSNGTYKAPMAIDDGIIVNTILAHSTEGDRRFDVYVLPKDKFASDSLTPLFNQSYESGVYKYVMGNALHYCDTNISPLVGNQFHIEQASDYALYVKNKSANITFQVGGYNDYPGTHGTSGWSIKWPVDQIGSVTVGSFSISDNSKTKTLEMFLDHCQKSGACPYGPN